ncbi:hypothetical protein B1R45_16055 [Pseudomonas azotoformans]|nr:hypothetical protein B1R45_16055 [Pseudomonas azotoformans]
MTQIQCGSGLARESGVPGKNVLTDTPLSRASPLPQGLRVQTVQRSVGQGSGTVDQVLGGARHMALITA